MLLLYKLERDIGGLPQKGLDIFAKLSEYDHTAREQHGISYPEGGRERRSEVVCKT